MRVFQGTDKGKKKPVYVAGFDYSVWKLCLLWFVLLLKTATA